MIPPSAAVLRRYERAWLRGDLLAGLTVAAYLVPQCMAYASVAGLPPLAGLWAVIAALLAYALLGSSRRLSVGPESTTALLTAAAIGPLAAGDPSRYAALAATLAVLVGLVCLVAWAFRLAVLADALSRPVLVGYLAGIAALMVVSQLTTVTGVPVDGGSFRQEVSSFAAHLGALQVAPTAVAATVLLFLLVAARLAPRVPAPLLAVVGASAMVALLPFQPGAVDLVGDLQASFPPAPTWLGFADLQLLVLPALGLAVVGYTDNILTARAFGDRHREEVDSGQELLALAAANVAAGLAQGFPVSSSGSRTAIGDATGARSQGHSVVAVVVVLLTIGFAGRWLAAFPRPALGALVIWAALQLVDVAEFRRIGRFRRSELLLALATTASVLLLDVLSGVVVAVALSALDVLRRAARPHDGVLGYVPGIAGMHDVDDYPEARLVPGLLVYRYDSPLFFANAADVLHRALQATEEMQEETGPVHWFVLNAEANVQIDITAVDALDELRQRLADRGIVFALARVKHDLDLDLDRAGLVDRVGRDRIFATLPTAVEAYAQWYQQRTGRRPTGLPTPPGAPPLP
ncbi:MAG: sulfate permease [Pseudorhodobacter sp.]|nr:sulfate permease [Frankiaceae bacterium]